MDLNLVSFFIPYSILGLIILIIIGALIIWVAGFLLAFLPAFIVAGVIWWITGNELFAGVGFLIVAVISLTQRKR
jgi:hypothetical protein